MNNQKHKQENEKENHPDIIETLSDIPFKKRKADLLQREVEQHRMQCPMYNIGH
jgi:hypothetical protein